VVHILGEQAVYENPPYGGGFVTIFRKKPEIQAFARKEVGAFNVF